MRFLGGVAPGGHVLDVACGAGRHLRTALDASYQVTGIDRDLSRIGDLEDNGNVRLIQSDLEDGAVPEFSDNSYDGVIVTNYLWRPLFPHIVSSLKPAGVLIYETFAIGNERYGKPSNRDYLLKPGELITAFTPALTPIAYEHLTTTGAPSTRVVQRICAVGPEHPWLADPPTKE